jgi:hypothetical protein
MVMLDEDEDGDEEPEGEGWELDPNDPTHPDFDLSEAGYSGVDSDKGPWHPPRALVIALTLLLVLAMLGPACARIFY